MLSDLDGIAKELKEKFLVDRGLLKPGGRQEILNTILQLRKKGLNAWVLVGTQNEPLEKYRELWNHLELRNPRDLLLLYNGARWEARGWGLSGAEISAALNSAEPDLRAYYGKGLVTALAGLAAKTGKAEEKSEEDSSWPVKSLSAAVFVGAGVGLAFIIRRRMRIQREAQEKFTTAFQSAKDVCADVILSARDLDAEDPESLELQIKAMALNEQLEGITQEVKKQKDLGGKMKTLGRLKQIQNELQVLMSTIMQKSPESKQENVNRYVEGKNLN